MIENWSLLFNQNMNKLRWYLIAMPILNSWIYCALNIFNYNMQTLDKIELICMQTFYLIWSIEEVETGTKVKWLYISLRRFN